MLYCLLVKMFVKIVYFLLVAEQIALNSMNPQQMICRFDLVVVPISFPLI